MSRLWENFCTLDGSVREMNVFLLQDGYLFRLLKLCIFRTSLGNFLLGNTCWSSGWTFQSEQDN